MKLTHNDVREYAKKMAVALARKSIPNWWADAESKLEAGLNVMNTTIRLCGPCATRMETAWATIVEIAGGVAFVQVPKWGATPSSAPT